MVRNKILLVEDERLIALDMKSTLENSGFKVVKSADSMEEAIQTIKKQRPDVIILDIQLEGKKTGIDLAKEINSSYEIPFLFLTSHYDPVTVASAKEQNPYSYLTKPYKDQDLVIAVQMIIANFYNNDLSQPTNRFKITTDTLYVKDQFAYKKINVDDTIFIKGEGNYVVIQMAKKKVTLRATLKDFRPVLDLENFFQVHRSYFVNFSYVEEIHKSHLIIQGKQVPISTRYRDFIIQRINTIR